MQTKTIPRLLALAKSLEDEQNRISQQMKTTFDVEKYKQLWKSFEQTVAVKYEIESAIHHVKKIQEDQQ